MDLDELARWITQPRPQDLLRIEALPFYESAGDHPHLERWRAELAVEMTEARKRWLDTIRGWTQGGATMRRVRVYAEPLEEYLRFEAEVHYTANAAAGELIRVLAVAPLQLGLYTDLYMRDGERVALMRYGDKGEFVAAQDAGDAARYWAASARDIWAAALPFDRWWAERRPQAA